VADEPLQSAGARRGGMLSLNISSRSALYAAFMPYLVNGGLFIPTNKPYEVGDEVFMLLSLMDDPTRIPVSGRVAWITPANAQNGKIQGIGVHFNPDDAGREVRRKIEGVLGSTLTSNRPTHTL
jgi:type IV pilus assembly protein PilZ